MPDVSGHIVTSYEQELKRLRDLLADMGGLVESGVTLSMRAVLERDAVAAERVIEQDAFVDKLERDVEAFVIRMLALRQPMARDLREIVASLRITAALERIGDYARNIAKRSLILNQATFSHRLGGLSHMSHLVQENLKIVIDAIGEGDAETAERVWRADEAVDDIYNAILRELITYMIEDPRNITPCTHLLFIAKNLERVGDHATNIAETVYFAATGDNLPDERPKGMDAVNDRSPDPNGDFP
jgi:phosphate transport system protein